MTIITTFAAPAAAQSVTGSIQGTVVDQSGAVLPGVTVTLTNTATGTTRTAVSDTTGTFRAELLPVGAVDLSADLPGFTGRKESGLDLTVGATLTLRVEMRVAGVAESVTVTSTTPVLETTSRRSARRSAKRPSRTCR